MIDPNRDEKIRLNPPGPHNNAYRFTPDELRVLKECNRDSFFQRCLPIGAIMGVSTYFGVNAGYIRSSPRFGAAPKVIVAVVVGYFIGKFSYQKKCGERLMQLPNSPIGEMLRQRRKGIFRETLEPGLGPGMSLAPFSNVSSSDTYSDVEPRGNVDIDTSRPDYDGLDDSHRPSIDNPIYEEEMPPMQKHATSYEELRKKNREEYQKKRTANFRDPVPEAPQQTENAQQQQPPSLPLDVPLEQPVTSQPRQTNRYGDALF